MLYFSFILLFYCQVLTGPQYVFSVQTHLCHHFGPFNNFGCFGLFLYLLCYFYVIRKVSRIPIISNRGYLCFSDFVHFWCGKHFANF